MTRISKTPDREVTVRVRRSGKWSITIEEENGNWVGRVYLTREELAAIVAAVEGGKS